MSTRLLVVEDQADNRRLLRDLLSGDAARALAAGCDAYVAKPFSPRALLAKVRAYLPS